MSSHECFVPGNTNVTVGSISGSRVVELSLSFTITYPKIGGQRYTFYIRPSWKLGKNCPLLIIICDVSDASSRAFCHRFAQWRIILFHIFTIGRLVVPQFCTCINTNSSVEEDSLFGLRQPFMIAEGREPFRSDYLFLGVLESVGGGC